MSRVTQATSLAAVLAVAVCFTAPASAQSTVQVGTLECTGGAGVGLIVGSAKSYDCTFLPANGGPGEAYEATITRIGLDIGVTGNSVMVWAVFAPSNRYESRALTGSYVGATADASVGVGGGGKVLVGGSENAFSLQPLSIQGQTGLNLAVGVAELKIQ
ncbi:MAG: DUF992 domain-containing protein [Hyphomicrobium sp.]|nr:DUF992 domain-containing protein [Hyphomicrobium sp.]